MYTHIPISLGKVFEFPRDFRARSRRARTKTACAKTNIHTRSSCSAPARNVIARCVLLLRVVRRSGCCRAFAVWRWRRPKRRCHGGEPERGWRAAASRRRRWRVRGRAVWRGRRCACAVRARQRRRRAVRCRLLVPCMPGIPEHGHCVRRGAVRVICIHGRMAQMAKKILPPETTSPVNVCHWGS